MQFLIFLLYRSKTDIKIGYLAATRKKNLLEISQEICCKTWKILHIIPGNEKHWIWKKVSSTKDLKNIISLTFAEKYLFYVTSVGFSFLLLYPYSLV